MVLGGLPTIKLNEGNLKMSVRMKETARFRMPSRMPWVGGGKEGGDDGGGEFLEGAVVEVGFGEGADADAAEAEDTEVEGGHQAADVAVAAFAED